MDDLTIPHGQRGILRLFSYDISHPEIARTVQDPDAPTEAELARLFGRDKVIAGSIEVVRLADVASLGLRDFLIEGHDVLPEALAAHSDVLDRLTGHVLIVHPSIAAHGAVDLRHTVPGVAYVGAFALGLPAPPPLALPEHEKPVALGGAPAPRPKQGSGALVGVLLLALVVFVMVFVLGTRP